MNETLYLKQNNMFSVVLSLQEESISISERVADRGNRLSTRAVRLKVVGGN